MRNKRNITVPKCIPLVSTDKVETKIIHPPCTDIYRCIDVSKEDKIHIASWGQFRKEKNHFLQIKVFAALSDQLKDTKLSFHVIGSTRTQKDEKLFEALKKIAECDVRNENHEIIFHKNVEFKKVQSILSKCKYALHTMKEEHFGISILEMMSQKIIPVCHASGGPLEDIIQNGKNGFLCTHHDEFVHILRYLILSSDEKWQNIIQENARNTSLAFSTSNFTTKFQEHLMR